MRCVTCPACSRRAPTAPTAIFFSSRGSNLDATDYDMNGIKLLQDGLPITTADGNNHNRVIDPLSARYATRRARRECAHVWRQHARRRHRVRLADRARQRPCRGVGQRRQLRTAAGPRHGQRRVQRPARRPADRRRQGVGRLSRSQQTDALWRVRQHRLAGDRRRHDASVRHLHPERAGTRGAAERSAGASGSGSGEPGRDRRQLSVERRYVACRQHHHVADRCEPQLLRRLFDTKNRSCYHPIVDKIMVDPDGPTGPDPGVRSVQPADRHQSPRRRRRDALRATHRRARAAVRPELRRQTRSTAITTATTAATATASPRRSTTPPAASRALRWIAGSSPTAGR